MSSVPWGIGNREDDINASTFYRSEYHTIGGYCAKRPTPMCHGLIEHQLGGAVRRIGREATAFGQRDAEYSFMSLGVCTEAADAEKCVRWAREFWDATETWSTGGVYVNYLGNAGTGRIEAAYGPEKYARLVALKNKYDPTNLFRLNQNIKPSQVTSAAISA